MPNTLIFCFAALFGLIFGSFANVLILRDNRRRTIMTGRSACPQCGHELAWYELIPLLSFLVQSGRCRACKGKMSWQYPVVELFGAALAVLAAWQLAEASFLAAVLLFFGYLLMLVVSAIDIRTQMVPVEYVVAAGLLMVAARSLAGNLTLVSALSGALIGGGFLALVIILWKVLMKTNGMGDGDIWIAAALGLAVGYPGIIVLLVGAVFSGAIVGSLALASGKAALKTAIPFGPFLFAGCLAAMVWAPAILEWYTRFSGITF